MNVREFLARHNALPEQIPAQDCLSQLLTDMQAGLSGHGRIPMLPSYLCHDICVPAGAQCCVLDAGGTNLRTALAEFDENGRCHLSHLTTQPMPGTQGTLSLEAFYQALAAPLRSLHHFEKVGFCFSYNVTMDRTLDGTLEFWCKEVRAPEAVGKPVGASLKAALGTHCHSVHVLNDSVAAMLGAGTVDVGVILGTGVNVCYPESCTRISKAPQNLSSGTMIISTEVGEFTGIPKSTFDQAVIDASDAPGSAHAEKQCSGGYLGDIIHTAWQTASQEGIPNCPEAPWTLAQISAMLQGNPQTEAAEIAGMLIHRAAKVAAILCAGPMLRAAEGRTSLRVAVEGSQYWKLSGFRECFHRELQELLTLEWEILPSENACLIGAARAAFAKPM